MKQGFSQFILAGAVILLGFAAVFGLSSYLENNRVSLPQSYEDEDLALQGKRLKGYALGFEGLLADWYWMRSLQYIGDKMVRTSDSINMDDLRPLNPRLLYPLLENASELDPRFIPVYSYGATVLPAVDPAQAIALTEKGIRHNPEQWRLFQYLGYIHWKTKNYEKAAEVYKRGSQIPGAPPFLGLMAARMNTEGGSRETAREMYSQMLAGAQDEQTKTTAELRLMELDSHDEREAINGFLTAFREKNGRCVESLHEILRALASVELRGGKDFRVDGSRNLVDPSGTPYILDRESCEAKLDGKNSKIPVF